MINEKLYEIDDKNKFEKSELYNNGIRKMFFDLFPLA